MSLTHSEIASLLALKQYPRSASYDPIWVLENQMGPNVLWLTEALSQVLELNPGMRVLDMGCGKAVSSIFLAKEFGVQVWATDLWIDASDNWRRIQAAGMGQQVFPISAEAHALPFAREFFDAIYSMDAYHYFGTGDMYLGQYFYKLVKPGGLIGIIVPGLVKEFNRHDIPEHLKPYWEWEFHTFHSPEWWRQHWEKTGLVEVLHADTLPDGWKEWLHWNEVRARAGFIAEERETEMLQADAGRSLGFTRLVARRKA